MQKVGSSSFYLTLENKIEKMTFFSVIHDVKIETIWGMCRDSEWQHSRVHLAIAGNSRVLP